MTFETLGLQARLVRKLADQGITQPTAIQTQAIPPALAGRDVMGIAQTGTGKTAAYGLPIAHRLLTAGDTPAPKTVRSLILAPTRELAKQIADTLGAYVEGTHLKVALVVGGASINAQVNRLHRGADLLVATPGRLLDLIDRKAVRLDATRYLVLDEADQMLDLGFIHALRRIAPLLSKDRQTMLFSATMPKLMDDLSRTYLTDPVRVEASPPGQPADKVAQALYFVEQTDKAQLLIDHLDAHREDLALVFTRTKHGADRLMKALDRAGFAAGAIHGNKSQGQRERAIKAFRSGEMRVLVATDVAARGLDIPGVRHVYNYDLPNVPDTYVHRIGRTARAGRDGRAVAYCAPAEISDLKAIHKTIGREIPVLGGTPWSDGRAAGGRRSGPAKAGAAKPRAANGKRRRPRNRRAA
ncbi:DEAD/DEAH box helicase [Psychromarinibacter sp. C21-152]|uniref:DEAD/DEAH box helicase n=1 Tax=Psychromarinibacter sediminicola TaxID=3033385 RepID=A0AAE3NRJ3_9RHOB|nr:DEAD/DEAH box helicase [Psychromarinibacter sediminicola]MDF0600344.1 DEAD/DEAH box helicase [Psychromarinibacter sediminicola]